MTRGRLSDPEIMQGEKTVLEVVAVPEAAGHAFRGFDFFTKSLLISILTNCLVKAASHGMCA
jgi:hypothetical protein